MLVQVIKKGESIIYQNEIYGKGEVLEMRDSVAESLIKRGYVEPVVDVEPVDVVEPIEGHLDSQQLEELSYQDLKALAKEMGLSAVGKRDELIARITAVSVSVEPEAVSDEMPMTSMPE